LHTGSTARVFTVNASSKLVAIDVVVGRTQGEFEEIVSGLDESTQVVARDVDTLKTGDLVRVLAARERQYARQGADVCNAAIPPPQLAEHCPLSANASRMFAAAFQRLGLTARAHDRVLRVARTIADLEGTADIGAAHLAEAINYRSLDRGSWGR
jgi:predicted ATPase with chaperone activity